MLIEGLDVRLQEQSRLLAALSSELGVLDKHVGAQHTKQLSAVANVGKEVEGLARGFESVNKQLGGLHALVDRVNIRVRRLRRDLDRPPSLVHTEPEPEFLELVQTVQAHGTTTLGPDRLYVLWQAAKNVRHLVDAAAAEVGTYRGGSAYFIARALGHFDSEHPAQVHVIDTFEGHPEERRTEGRDDFHPAGKFGETSFEDVRRYLGELPGIQVHRGEFTEVRSALPDVAYRLVHVDTDLYQPTLDCLNYFGPRLCRGGIVIVDDYGAETCQGVVDAVQEYLLTQHEFEVWDVVTEQLMLVRR